MKTVDILILVVIAVLIVLAIGYMIKNKKRGKSTTGCSGNCSCCVYHKRDCTLSR